MIHQHENGDNLFFTADHHFGHANIIEYCYRPFKDVDEMDAEMIAGWNEVVPSYGTVYYLSDFYLGNNPYKYFSHLNGHIKTLNIHWHHDKRWLKQASDWNRGGFYTRTGVVDVLGQEAVIQVGDQFIHLSHYPLGSWDRQHYGAWHLHGHSHGNYQGDSWENKCMDVGVDVWNYRPVSYKEIKTWMEK